MDSKTSGRKTGQEDSVDVDVDNYFLPGGILDLPSHEEDMIGGSLLDEIGGVGNVTVSSFPLLFSTRSPDSSACLYASALCGV